MASYLVLMQEIDDLDRYMEEPPLTVPARTAG